MARGAYLTPRIKELLGEIYTRNRGIRPTDARKELLEEIKNEGLDKIFGPDFPSVSSVSKLLTEYRERDKARSPELRGLDKPWHISTQNNYPIPPEALPIVLRVWAEFSSENKLFTIRMAKWVARLYATLQDKPINYLITMVYNYAYAELLTEVVGIEWDSRLLDYWLYTTVVEASSPKLLQLLIDDKFKDAIPNKHELEKNLKKLKTREAQNERAHNQEG